MHKQLRNVLTGTLSSLLLLSTSQISTAAPIISSNLSQANHTSNAVSSRTIPGRPNFPDTPPRELNKKILRDVHFKLAPAFATPMLLVDAQPEAITISGPATATQEQMVAFIKKHNPQPKLTCTLEELVSYYYQEAGLEGIRPDVALCQAIKETGFFGYGGDVAPTQNNFCGLGATGNHEPGAKFATAQLGARAHIQHLLAYAKTTQPTQKIIDPRYWHVVKNRPDLHGKVTAWTGLNGAWAVPGKNYGQEILLLWRQAQAPDDSDISLAAANKRVANAPDEAESYVYRGTVLYNRHNYQAALADFKLAVQLVPQASEAYYDLALTMTQLSDTKAALKAYDKLLSISPNYNQAWYNRGLIHFNNHDYKNAISDMQTLLTLEERSADAQNLIGVAHIAQKEYATAWQDFAQAATINSANMNVLANQFILEACLK